MKIVYKKNETKKTYKNTRSVPKINVNLINNFLNNRKLCN